jgi:hypothetical protein
MKCCDASFKYLASYPPVDLHTKQVVVGEHNVNEVDGAEVQVKIAKVVPNILFQE